MLRRIALGSLLVLAPVAFAEPWWGPDIESSLNRYPARKLEWSTFLQGLPKDQRNSAAYLVRYMPYSDLVALPTKLFEENLKLAQKVRGQVPWGRSIPEDVFQDAILPYANVTEPRDLMRAEFLRKYLPLVKDCKTPAEAAQKLNSTLFKDYKVSYNTRRLRTDQSPRESISQGMATCTGLSIMLVDACRAVGVPARVAGINSWPGRGGNHTWVEIWDKGWHFTGACEPDPQGLDRGWFVGDASKAIATVPVNSIYAVTYKSTGDFFPLAWDDSAKINAENVTARYAPKPVVALPRLMVEVLQGGVRVVADVMVTDASGKTILDAKSFGPTADMNNHVSVSVPVGSVLKVVVKHGDRVKTQSATVEKDSVLRFDLDKA